MDWIRILTDPDPPEMARMLHVGQFVTWPKLHMIENRMRLERQLYLGRQAVKQAQQSSHRGPKDPLPPTSAGHQNSTIGAMKSLSEESDDDDFDTRTLDAPEGWTAPAQAAVPRPSSSNNVSFLSRLRTQSFPGLTSPIRRKGRIFMREGKAGQAETSGSSDSSSAEDQPQRPAYHPTVLRSRTDVRQIFTGRRVGVDDGSDGDQEDEDL